MGVLDKIFGGGRKVPKESLETKGEHSPNLQIPVDEKFTINFKKNGGKFVYCEDIDEVVEGLKNTLFENQWQNDMLFCMDPRLESRFEELLFFTDDRRESDILFTTCEHLVADNGSILFCSNQVKGMKVDELPSNFIVFATTSQMVGSISEGMKVIKNKYPADDRPDHITTVKNFGAAPERSVDFLSYGSSSKNVYLLLMEDY